MSNQVTVFNVSERKFLPKKKVIELIKKVLANEKIEDSEIGIIFCKDSDIHKLNKSYLEHDYSTDVISFTLEKQPLLGEIYISVDTAEMQAREYKVSLSNELLRLSAHGTLHLCGYDDDTEEQKIQMTQLEDKYLNNI